MKSIQQVASQFNAVHSSANNPATLKIEATRETASVVNELFKTLKSISPGWQNAFPTPDIENEAKREWIKAFAESGIVDSSQTDLGVSRRRNWNEPWFPACGQFIEWCKPLPEDYGLLPVELAFKEAFSHINSAFPHDWSHAAVFVAAKSTGTWEFSSLTYDKCFQLFSRNYEVAVNRVMAGENLEAEIPKAIPAKVEQVTEHEQARSNVEGLKSLLKRSAIA